jgi:hypothetical protein
MDSENLRDTMIEITIQGKQYALVPLCMFHDIPTNYNENGYKFRFEVVEQQFGLKDVNQTYTLHEVIDPKKVMLAKIKYGV